MPHLPLRETPLAFEFLVRQPPPLPLIEHGQPRALQVEQGDRVVGTLLLLQAQTFFLRPQSVLQHLHLHRLVRLEVRGGGGQAGADAETETGERVVVGEDHDGLHRYDADKNPLCLRSSNLHRLREGPRVLAPCLRRLVLQQRLNIDCVIFMRRSCVTRAPLLYFIRS